MITVDDNCAVHCGEDWEWEWEEEGGDSGGSGFADREMNCRCCASMFRVLFVKWRSQALGSAFPESELRILSLEDNGFKR